MRKKHLPSIILLLTLVALLTGISSADDGLMFRRNISKTPAGETEEAAIGMMKFYVPAQNSLGELTTVEYFDAAGALVETRDNAKPLVSIYIDGLEEEDPEPIVFQSPVGGVTEGSPFILGGVGFGHRDAFSALSLDDGTTWKRRDLSDSAHLSSFTLGNGLPYPGDVHYMTLGVDGDKVLAGWLSKYCASGSPLHTYTEEEIDTLRSQFPHLNDLYVTDLFGVSGSQSSVDYTQQGFPEVGEIPYSCVWTARGQLLQDEDTGLYDIVWTKAERLTSGRRDANRLEIGASQDAGFVMVWQEDPEGLRPGQGLGPGEGWSGAIVNQKTDIWYSYLDWEDFNWVLDADGNPVLLEEYVEEEQPKVALPMAMPLRLSDNNMCKGNPTYDTDGNLLNPYCYYDYDTGTLPTNIPDPSSDFCTDTVSWTNPGGTTLEICQTENGRVLWGRTGAARPRINLQPYDQDGDGIDDSAWVVMAYEELKALGDEVDPITLEPLDIGKNIWYHSFDMFAPNMVSQGGMLNQPAKDRETGEFFPVFVDEWDNDLYETEIARRFNLMSQSAADAVDSDTKTTAVLIYKQGIINQGGPADIYLRRLLLPDTYDPATDNPYAFENIVCDNWVYSDGANPNYVKGLCLDDAINVSGSTIVQCDNGSSGDTCADQFPWDGGEEYPKVTEWAQTEENLADQSWVNPYDVSKGHRGFLDGDFIMMMYAWSPNWKANSVGNDHYNLYVRRSFDGGLSWTTTPGALGGVGTETCEWYGHGSNVYETCTTYAAGEFEQARNVSQLVGNRVTVLDPRYTQTTDDILTDSSFLYPDDERDPSRFFIVYETGDNTTVAEGEATPLDLFYSRAYYWGDEYDYVEVYKDKDGDGNPELYEEWDWLENKQDDLSGEAGVTANPAGTFFYAVWNQWQEPEEDVIENSDIIFRRVMYLDTIDGLPTASILYTSHRAADYDAGNLMFMGGGRDNDHIGNGLVGYEWQSSLDGLLSTQKSFTMPVTAFSLGMHTLTYRVLDDEGNWSTEIETHLLIAEEIYDGFLPFAKRHD